MTHPQTQDDEALVEVMARAICEARALPGTKPAKPAPWASEVDRRAARAALTALRNHEGRK